MSRPHAAAQPSTAVAARPNTIVAAPVYYGHTSAGAPTPGLLPTPIPFAGHFPPLGTPPPWPYPAPFYPIRPPPAFPPVMPPGPPAYPPPPPPPGVPVDHRSIMQYPVRPGPPGFPPSLIYPPPGVLSYQGPALSHGTVDPATMDRLRFPPVAPPDITRSPPVAPSDITRSPPVAPPHITHFTVYVGKIAPTVDNDFVLSLLQVCGVVKTWEPVTNPMDGSHAGFGFCVFESAEGSLRAKRLLNKLSVDGQELVLNVNQATRDYFQKYGESTSEGKAKEVETKTRDGVVSLTDNGNDLSRAIPDVTADKDAIKRIRSMIQERMKNKICLLSKKIEERMKNKLLVSSTLAVQASACIVDENVNDDARSSALEERKVRRQGEKEEHLGEMKAVGLEGQKGKEVTGKSSLPIDEAPSMHVLMECESTVVHERSQHMERDGFHKNKGEGKGMERKTLGSEGQKDREVTAAGKSSLLTDEAPLMHVRMGCESQSTAKHERKNQRRERIEFTKSIGEENDSEKKAVGLEGQKDREVTAAGKSSLQTDKVPLMHVRMECESTVEHERRSQRWERDGFTKSNGEEKSVVFVPGLVSDKQNMSAVEKVGLELQATSMSGDKKTLDAKQLLATVPKTKKELFAHDIHWAIYDKFGLHERMRPWISRKATEVFGEELAEFVDYVIASIKEHVDAPRMLELLESLLDDDAEKFVLLMWRKLIFEIKRVEEGLA